MPEYVPGKHTKTMKSALPKCPLTALDVQAGRWGFSPSRRLVMAVKTKVSELQMGTAFEMSGVVVERPCHRQDLPLPSHTFN